MSYLDIEVDIVIKKEFKVSEDFLQTSLMVN
jgi:hypothetical protein